MQNSEVLNLAADHIEMYGHRKGGLGVFGEPTCALGAIRVFEPAVGGRTDAGVALTLYLGGPIHRWNNAPDRTAAEVVVALRACAVIEASRERQPVEAVTV